MKQKTPHGIHRACLKYHIMAELNFAQKTSQFGSKNLSKWGPGRSLEPNRLQDRFLINFDRLWDPLGDDLAPKIDKKCIYESYQKQFLVFIRF